MTPALVRLDEALMVADAYAEQTERRRQLWLAALGTPRALHLRAMWQAAVEQYEAAQRTVASLTEPKP